MPASFSVITVPSAPGSEPRVDDVAVDRAEGVAQAYGERQVIVRGQLFLPQKDFFQAEVAFRQGQLIPDALIPAVDIEIQALYIVFY